MFLSSFATTIVACNVYVHACVLFPCAKLHEAITRVGAHASAMCAHVHHKIWKKQLSWWRLQRCRHWWPRHTQGNCAQLLVCAKRSIERKEGGKPSDCAWSAMAWAWVAILNCLLERLGLFPNVILDSSSMRKCAWTFQQNVLMSLNSISATQLLLI